MKGYRQKFHSTRVDLRVFSVFVSLYSLSLDHVLSSLPPTPIGQGVWSMGFLLTEEEVLGLQGRVI